jgi:subtilisin family serine protease
MNRMPTPLSAAIAATLACTALPSTALSAELRTSRQPIEGRYIVVLKPEVASLANERATRARVPDVARLISASHRVRLLYSYQSALRGFVVEADHIALARLLADARVAYVEEDGVAYIHPTQGGATWGIDRVDQRDLPLSGTYTYNTTAANVHAYIIDSGVHPTHSEFTGRMGNGFTAIADGLGSGDCNGHGTHVAGTTAGSTWGIAKAAIVHPVRVFGCGNSGSWADIIAGIDWVASNRQLPAVANLSLGGGASASVDAAVNNLVSRGVVAVVAAGNSNADACGFSPARVPAAVTVGSTQSNDARSGFSNYGSCLDLFAPGSGITSSWYTGNNATAVLDGTSMASPHVAGAAALHLAGNPSATPAQVAAALINAATPGKVTSAGNGSPNRLLYTLGGNDTNKLFEQTDASGKVTIAVFERTSSVPLSHNTDFAIPVPSDYVVIGGGALGKNSPQGNLLTASYPNTGLTAWLVSTKDHVNTDPLAVRGWAIGLKIAGLSADQLRGHLTVSTATSGLVSHADITATLPSGFILVGGGFKVNWSGAGNMGTASMPSGSTGWRARSKDHMQSSPATTQAYAIGLRADIGGIGSFSSLAGSSLSAVASHPATTANVPAGYALAGCGALVNWSGSGSLLWRIQPLQVGGTQTACSVASKDHLESSPASINGYAIGLRGF